MEAPRACGRYGSGDLNIGRRHIWYSLRDESRHVAWDTSGGTVADRERRAFAGVAWEVHGGMVLHPCSIGTESQVHTPLRDNAVRPVLVNQYALIAIVVPSC
jgi:hypothetical protein